MFGSLSRPGEPLPVNHYLNFSNSRDIRASWFETRGVAALLTMRNWQTSS
jgi:hypothetical protein